MAYRYNPFTGRHDIILGVGNAVKGGTATRVLFIDSSGNLADDAGLVYAAATDTLTVPNIDGSTAANGDLTLQGTSNATRTTSYVILQPNGGNVGIGTITPTAKLQIVDASPVAALSILNSSSAEVIRLTTNNSDGFFRMYDAAGNIDIQLAADEISYFQNGNVGIGTTTPASLLNIYGATVDNTAFGLTLSASGVVTNRLIFFPSGNYGYVTRQGNANSFWSIQKSDGTVQMYFKGDGSVGIGTTSPATQLQVAGKISVGATVASGQGRMNLSDETTYAKVQSYGDVPLSINPEGNKVGIGTIGPDRLLHSEANDTTTNAVTQVLRLTHATTGTPAANIAVGQEYEVETSASNFEVIATIEAVATAVGAGVEEGALVFKTMTGGAVAAERVRITSTDLRPAADDTYYLGKNDDDTPFAWKGVILKDTTNGKYYRIEVINGTITATDLTD